MARWMMRAGQESEAVKRLLLGITDNAVRDILARCMDGSISPSVALMQMLIETEDEVIVRAAVDDVTRRAAALSRSGDNLVRDRVDDLTQLVVENEHGCRRIAEMLRSNMDSPDPAPSVEEGIAFCERLFDWSVQQSEEASVALYSLGNPELLEKATAEIVAQLSYWNAVTPQTTVLDIGCGIGRMLIALAPRVHRAIGIDVSAKMADAARRRCAHLPTVTVIKGNGRGLGGVESSSCDVALAVDSFP